MNSISHAVTIYIIDSDNFIIYDSNQPKSFIYSNSELLDRYAMEGKTLESYFKHSLYIMLPNKIFHSFVIYDNYANIFSNNNNNIYIDNNEYNPSNMIENNDRTNIYNNAVKTYRKLSPSNYLNMLREQLVDGIYDTIKDFDTTYLDNHIITEQRKEIIVICFILSTIALLLKQLNDMTNYLKQSIYKKKSKDL